MSNGYMPDCRVELRDTVNPSKPFGCDVRRGVGDLTGVVERGGDEVVILNVPSTCVIDMEPGKGRSPLLGSRQLADLSAGEQKEMKTKPSLLIDSLSPVA